MSGWYYARSGQLRMRLMFVLSCLILAGCHRSDASIGSSQLGNEDSELVLIEFFATWCGPCRQQGPILAEVESDRPYGVKVKRVDIDKEPDLAAKYNVESIPTLVIERGGVEKARLVGLMPKERIIGLIRQGTE
jgi:thioredoxin 1